MEDLGLETGCGCGLRVRVRDGEGEGEEAGVERCAFLASEEDFEGCEFAVVVGCGPEVVWW